MLVVLLMDEMYIRAGLVYKKHSGEIVGFSNLGNINNHLLEFERQVKGDEKPVPSLAKTMMVFMVRGLFSPLRFAYAQFPCAKLTGSLLVHPFWEAIYRLERMTFKVTMFHLYAASNDLMMMIINCRCWVSHLMVHRLTVDLSGYTNLTTTTRSTIFMLLIRGTYFSFLTHPILSRPREIAVHPVTEHSG